MKKILVLYATREGQTGKIAQRITAHLRAQNCTVDLVNAADKAAAALIKPEAYELLVFGASLHAGHVERELLDFIRDHKDGIERKDRSFFLVLLSAATKDPKARATSLDTANRQVIGQLPVSFAEIEMIAGALKFSKYTWPVTWIMKRIARKSGGDTDASRDHEYTDWLQVERYAEKLASG